MVTLFKQFYPIIPTVKSKVPGALERGGEDPKGT